MSGGNKNITFLLPPGIKGLKRKLRLPLLVKTDFTTIEIKITNHSQDITKKQLQQQLKVPSTLLYNTYIEKKISHSF